ncbi:MAG: ABC transporter substrate-binding protein [Actinobacteria bacterium]|nr:ABC transporter substrate-binding protein [Actinomycetota bacterium]
MKRRTSTAVVAVLALVAALVTAVSAGARSQGDVTIFVAAPVATPIENYPDAPAGAEAAAAAINKAGGLNGSQIKISFCNTQSNPNVAQACARQAVSEKAIAYIGYPGTQSPLQIPILKAAGIPIIGFRSSGNPVDWTDPTVFTPVGGPASAYQALPFAFKTLGKKRLFISYQDVPSAANNAKNALRAAKIAGIPIAGTMVLPGATTDFAPFVQKLREANPDAVMFINSPGVSGGMMRAAESLGVKPLWGHNSGSIGEPEAAQIGDPSKNMLIASDYPSFRDSTQYPGIRKFLAEMQAAGKDGDPVNLKVTGISTWLTMKLIQQLAKGIKGEVTNANLMAALKGAAKPINVEGLVNWAPGAKGPAAIPRWSSIGVYFLTFRNGQAVSWGKELPQLDLVKALKYVR